MPFPTVNVGEVSHLFGHAALTTLAEQYSRRLRYICPNILFFPIFLFFTPSLFQANVLLFPQDRKEESQHPAASSQYWAPDLQADKGTDQDLGKDKIVKKEILQPSLFFPLKWENDDLAWVWVRYANP